MNFLMKKIKIKRFKLTRKIGRGTSSHRMRGNDRSKKNYNEYYVISLFLVINKNE